MMLLFVNYHDVLLFEFMENLLRIFDIFVEFFACNFCKYILATKDDCA